MSGEGIIGADNAQVIRGAAHYNALQGDAWKQRAERAEARVAELEQELEAARRGGTNAMIGPHCQQLPGVPGCPPTRPGTQFFSGGDQ